MEYIWVIFFFVFGAAIGSFLQVVVDRYGSGLSFFRGRSFCFSCTRPLKPLHLFPVFSFLFLKGRCAYCKSKIPLQSFLIELISGLLAVLLAYKTFGHFLFPDFPILHTSYLILHFLLLFSIFSVILLISIYDLRHSIIPDHFLITLGIFSLSYIFIIHNSYFIIQHLISAFVLPLPFLLLFILSRGQWLGFGDIKYVFFVGLLLGLPQGLSAVILAFWIGAFFSVLAIILQKNFPALLIFGNKLTIKSEIPFGPFISVGVFLSFWFSIDLFHLHALFNF